MDHHGPTEGRRKKRVTDLFWRLDCTNLARSGVFGYPGNRGRISWSRQSGKTLIEADYLFAQYAFEGPTLRLVMPAGNSQPPITIKLATTDLHFGGRRWWFLCPGCGRRAGILYSEKPSPPFLCRLCLCLAYQTQLHHKRGRAALAANKVRRRFDGSSMGSPFPPRPRGMHWETYFRLYDKHSKATKVFYTSFRAELERLHRSNKRDREKAVRRGWISE
jgi:hypothetical protein